MSDKNEGGLEKSLQQDFGGVVFEYRDDQAIADGVLIPLMANKRDTDHRMTSNAFETLKGHHRQRGYANYGDAEFYKFFFAEMIPLVPFAKREYERGGVFKTTYDFKVVQTDRDVLWYLPNEIGGVTMMLPSDY